MPSWDFIPLIKGFIGTTKLFHAPMSCLPSSSGPSGCEGDSCVSSPSPCRPGQCWAMLGNRKREGNGIHKLENSVVMEFIINE